MITLIEGQIYDPVEMVLADLVKEAVLNKIVNENNNKFWERINQEIFSNPLVSFDVAYEALASQLADAPEDFDYFIRLVIRTMSKPYAKDCLDCIKGVYHQIRNVDKYDKLLTTDLEKASHMELIIFLLASQKTHFLVALKEMTTTPARGARK